MIEKEREPEQEDTPEEEGPDASELHEDPAYNPQDEDLKGLKGG